MDSISRFGFFPEESSRSATLGLRLLLNPVTKRHVDGSCERGRQARDYTVWCKGSAMIRIQVPKAYQAIIGETALTETIGKVNKCEAAQLALPIVAEFLARIERAKAGTYGDDPALTPRYIGRDSFGMTITKIPPAAQEPAHKPVTFTDVIAVWALENTNPGTLTN